MKQKLPFFSIIIVLCLLAQNATNAADPYIRIKKGENIFFDRLDLKVDSTQLHLQVKITDLLGQVVGKFEILRSLTFVPTASLKPGYYIVRISSGAYITTKRVVITA
ncbi:hypothetical protein BKI52_10610 [marine bacterium AO1-C]|nr:hypothetical protein BKI52_10610 [marine bacterium AO1-C]